MKALFEHVRGDAEQSFICYWVHRPAFEVYWHYHPEFELTFTRHGSGSRIVGDHTAEYSAGDLVLLGSNLPHAWISEPHREKPSDAKEAVVIQFSQELFTQPLLQLPEMGDIRRMLDLASRGLLFSKKVAKELSRALVELVDMKGVKKLTSLMLILNELAQAETFTKLSSPLYSPTLGKINEQRLNQAVQYIHHHYTELIPLAKMAEMTHLTETSFCRFFKKMTGKTFSDYVNDLRVGRACKLLAEKDERISELAYASGFNSMTHFNRVFLRKRDMSPGAYRKKFRV